MLIGCCSPIISPFPFFFFFAGEGGALKEADNLKAGKENENYGGEENYVDGKMLWDFLNRSFIYIYIYRIFGKKIKISLSYETIKKTSRTELLFLT